MSKKKKNKKISQSELMNDLQEFSNKYDLGLCIFISVFKGELLSSAECNTEIVKNTLYSTIGNIYMKIIEANEGNQAVRDWVNQDIEIATMLMKKLYLSEELK